MKENGLIFPLKENFFGWMNILKKIKWISYLRLVACSIWFACGVISGGDIGYMSALASAMFFIAGAIELKG